MSRRVFKQLYDICRLNFGEMRKEEEDAILQELTDLLDDEGIDVNVAHPRFKGCVLLCEACRVGNLKVVEILIRRGADVNFCDRNSCSPLYIAASSGHLAIVQLLTSHDADVNVKSFRGYAPLLSAVENNHMDVANFLIDVGADVNVTRPNTYGIELTLLTFVLFAKNEFPFAEKLLRAGVIPHKFERPLNFILLEFGDECRDFVKKLVYAGFDFYCDGWIKNAKSKPADPNLDVCPVNSNEKIMVEFLEYEHANSPPLQRICRTTIRSCLVRSQVKGHLESKIDKLPLPNEVKRFLKLDYNF